MEHRLRTLSLYVLPSNCTDLRSTAPFSPFFPSFDRLLRQHLLMQQKQIPRTITPTAIQAKKETCDELKSGRKLYVYTHYIIFRVNRVLEYWSFFFLNAGFGRLWVNGIFVITKVQLCVFICEYTWISKVFQYWSRYNWNRVTCTVNCLFENGGSGMFGGPRRESG